MSASEKLKNCDKNQSKPSTSKGLDLENDAPWKLQPIFTYKGVKGVNEQQKHAYICNFCPTSELIKVALKSRYNLRRHVERNHKSLLHDYDELVKTGKVKHDCNHNNKMDNFVISKSSNPKPSQAKLDSGIVNMIIQANLPFTFVREQSFKDVVTLLQPGMRVLSYETLIRKMACQVKEMRENMIETFKSIKVCCMTADGWTCAKRSFIGVTIHWLVGMERKSAVLGCKRIIGRHTHDNLAKHLEEIIISFGLSDKLGGGCVTDNTANFVASFNAFGVTFESAQDEFELGNDENANPD